MANGKRMEFDEVFAAELDQITSRRHGASKDELIGLALSGGGIRSATFSLGVLEGLKGLGLLKGVDYLSTVSGGGYIGAWLSANCKLDSARRAASDKASAARSTGSSGESAGWLDESADWKASIRHLRRYSNYLSPKVGFLSADTWSMATVWLRNTLLVQSAVFLAIALALLVPRVLFRLFQIWPELGNWRWTTVVLFIVAVVGIAGNQWPPEREGQSAFFRVNHWLKGLLGAAALLAMAGWLARHFDFHPFADGPIYWVAAGLVAFCLVLAGLCLLPVAARLIGLLWRGNNPPAPVNYSQGWVQALVVIPIMASGFLMAAVLWGQAVGSLAAISSFGGFFLIAWDFWPFPLSIAFVSLWLFSFFSLRGRSGWKGWLVALLAPFPSVLVLHTLLCAIMQVLHGWAALADCQGKWLAFVFAPVMVLSAYFLSIVMLNGMLGRQSSEQVREWWSRLGAWLGIYGFAWMLITIAAVYGPRWAAILADGSTWKGASALGGWLGTTLAGLLAGKSEMTGRIGKGAQVDKSSKDKLLELIAVVAPFVFIAGLLIGISTCLHLLLLGLSDLQWDGFRALRDGHWGYLSEVPRGVTLEVMAAVLAGLLLLVWRVDINAFGLNAFYRNRLSRCYLGASRFLPGERSPQKFTEFDERDDLPMTGLQGRDGNPPAGPLHLINCALNLGGSSDLSLHTRHSASFTLTPYAVGSAYCSKTSFGTRSSLGFRAVGDYGGSDGQPWLGQAISVSGAAASPNMGYHTSPVVAFLLTVFNVRLGWWFPNPQSPCRSASPWFSLRYLVMELFGMANDRSNFLMISDGGHFENLAAYELIRRRCRVIIISDAECDPRLQFEGLGALIRMCEVDFDVKITLDVDAIRLGDGKDWSELRCAVGEIDYGENVPRGVLIYLKASMTGHEDSSVLQYKASHPLFPHESTGDQFFAEDQFESYRRLGKDIAETTFGQVGRQLDLVAAVLLERFSGLSK